MKIHDSCEQGSLEWLQLRAGKVTASEMDRLVSPLGKVRTGDGPKTFLLEKLAERWMGSPLMNDVNTFAMEQGKIIEERARPAFEMETGLTVKQVAFIETDCGRAGCSPDGIVEGQNAGLEIKAPGIVNHLRYLLDGCVPMEYSLQIQSSMWMTGFNEWWFFSFKRGMAPLIVKVQKDQKIQEAITEAIGAFLEVLDQSWERVIQLNGPPPIRKPFVPSSTERPKFTWESEMPS